MSQTSLKLSLALSEIMESILLYSKQSSLKQIPLPLYEFQDYFVPQSIQFKLRATRKIYLSHNSLHLVTRLLQIIHICLENAKENKIITKRNLFYKLNHYYKEYSYIDCDLKIICQSFCLKRKQLGIIASNRCMIYGKLTLQVDGIIKHSVDDNPSCITIPTCQDVYIRQLGSKKIILIQKQSMFYPLTVFLAQNKIIDYVVITAKGYPDLITRQILSANLHQLQIVYYLGDYDVYGFDIFLFYAFGDWKCNGILQKMQFLDLRQFEQDLFDVSQLRKEYQKLSLKDSKKLQQLQKKDYLKAEYYLQKKHICNKINKYRAYLDKFSIQNKKAQLQIYDKWAKSNNWIIQLVNLYTSQHLL